MQVYLNDDQAKELRGFIYDIMTKAIEDARRDTNLDTPALNQKEAAKWLNKSVNTIKKYEKAGMPVSYIDGSKQYVKEEIKKWYVENIK